MIVSMMQLILELPDIASLKEKRRIVKSAKERLQRKFRLSIAEIDLHNSLTFSQLGVAVVTTSKQHGEKVLHKALSVMEDEVPARIQDVHIYTERF